MLLILMYHRVHHVGRTPDALRTHFAYLRDHHPLRLPGDPLPRGELAVCLTFDDATVDFYAQVYPLLATLDARALLAVPTGFIEPATTVPMPERLVAQQRAAMGSDYAMAGSPLCTWAELREMQASGRVRCAAHGHHHRRMTDPGTDPEVEAVQSRQILERHLGVVPDTFVYPFGRASPAAQRIVRRHYPYAMRIGGAINRNWSGNAGLLYRVDAEHFWPQGRVWSWRDAVAYRLKYLANRLRGK